MTAAGVRAATGNGAGRGALRRRGGGRVVPLVALGLALALAALLVLFIVFSSPERLVPSATAPPGDEAPAPSVAPAGDTVATQPADAARDAPPDAADASGERARAMIAEIRARDGEVDLEGLYAEAMRFRDGGAAADAHLLLFFAARQGHIASARELGRTYDPAHHAAGIVAEPSLPQAYKWYRLAADGGDSAALDALTALRARVEQAAAGGDEDASLLLSRWRS